MREQPITVPRGVAACLAGSRVSAVCAKGNYARSPVARRGENSLTMLSSPGTDWRAPAVDVPGASARRSCRQLLLCGSWSNVCLPRHLLNVDSVVQGCGDSSSSALAMAHAQMQVFETKRKLDAQSRMPGEGGRRMPSRSLAETLSCDS